MTNHPKDDYGVLGSDIEIDSDVNEDRNREEQLDDSFESWYENMNNQIKQQLKLTNVPEDGVFDSVAGTDEDSGRH
ncbi:hypothetical protein [Paenibacillus lactis]|uniref:hypothetical protein n=1 Tax=Paenibacillus lactis TaxID=228574 RepID=UPI0011A9F31B